MEYRSIYIYIYIYIYREREREREREKERERERERERECVCVCMWTELRVFNLKIALHMMTASIQELIYYFSLFSWPVTYTYTYILKRVKQ